MHDSAVRRCWDGGREGALAPDGLPESQAFHLMHLTSHAHLFSRCRARAAAVTAQVPAAVRALSSGLIPTLTPIWRWRSGCLLRRSGRGRMRLRLLGGARQGRALRRRLLLRLQLQQAVHLRQTWSLMRTRCCSRPWPCPCRYV